MRFLIALCTVLMVATLAQAEGPMTSLGELQATVQMDVVPHKYKPFYTADPAFIHKIAELKSADPDVFSTAEIREMLGLPPRK